MTLDEAIKRAEEVAEKNDRRAESVRNRPISSADFYHEEESCSKYATEHRQLAEWLKELKAHREAWGKAKRTVKAYLMLEGFGSAYQDDIENLIEGCIPKGGTNDQSTM